MDANRSAFSAYKIAPSKFVEKQKTPKKHNSKKNGLPKSPAGANTSHENRTPAKKRARPVELHDEGAPSYASSSEHALNEAIGNGRAKVNNSISTEHSFHFLRIVLFHMFFSIQKQNSKLKHNPIRVQGQERIVQQLKAPNNDIIKKNTVNQKRFL